VTSALTTSDGSAASESVRGRVNVVTIVLDCARAKSFGPNEAGTTAHVPVLDDLARRGSVFSRAVAPSNWTVPSHYSLLTGSYPSVHGVRTYQRAANPPRTTAAYLRDQGYQTAIFSENRLLAGYGLEEGFETQLIGTDAGAKRGAVVSGRLGRVDFLSPARLIRLFSALPPLIAPLAIAHRRQEVGYKRVACSDRILDHFSEWLGTRDAHRPFYAFFNLVDTHDPYEVISVRRLGWLERVYLYTPRFFLLAIPEIRSHVDWRVLLAGYIASIEAADKKIGRLVSILDRLGELDRTLIVITADHGQSFGEMGHVYHGTGATDSVIRVPLYVVPPRGVIVPERIDRWTSLCEVDSWIRSSADNGRPFDSAGVVLPGYASDATNLLAVYGEGAPATDLIRSVRTLAPGQLWNHRLLAAYRTHEKFILDLDTGQIQRWDLRTDPDLAPATEIPASDVDRIRAEVFGPYEALDEARARGARPGTSASDVSIDERLKSWGYD
jgi:hypothetical protein